MNFALGLKFLSVADQTYHWGILDREIIWLSGSLFYPHGFFPAGKN
jgi:thiol:disulfide interchange protein DsbD